MASEAAAGRTATLTDSSVGYEWDEDVDNGVRPAGLVRLSTTIGNGVEVLQDFGHTYAIGNATHHVTLYRDTNGAGPTRSCSAPAPCSGRGGWTPTTTAAARRPTPR